MSENKTAITKLNGSQAAKAVNLAFAARGVTMVNKKGETVVKTIPAQMMYNYLGKDMIKHDAKNLIDAEDLRVWFERYLENYLRRQENANKVLPVL
jgi:hypothetical protein